MVGKVHGDILPLVSVQSNEKEVLLLTVMGLIMDWLSTRLP